MDQVKLSDLPGPADFIISRHSLEHVIDPALTLLRWRDLLKLNGKILIILPDHEYIDTMDYQFSAGKHLHAYTRKSFCNLATILDLTPKKIETVVPEWSFGVILEDKPIN